MSWHSTSSWPQVWLALRCSLLFQLVAVGGSSLFCSRDIYDSPDLHDCSQALATLPQADQFYRYYLEPQLATIPPALDWQGWIDERPPIVRQKIVQVPKIWSCGEQTFSCIQRYPIHSMDFPNSRKRTETSFFSGSCNIALLSYVDRDTKTGFSLSRWADVYLAGYTLIQACLNLHSQGGAATVISKY